MKTGRMVVALAVSVLTSCSPRNTPASGHTRRGGVVTVSLVNLIATPAEYHLSEVIAIGVLRTEFEGTALYLHGEDLEHQVAANAVWLEFGGGRTPAEDSELAGQYVAVQGTFDAGRKGHWGRYAGTIKVSKIIRWTPASAAQPRQ